MRQSAAMSFNDPGPNDNQNPYGTPGSYPPPSPYGTPGGYPPPPTYGPGGYGAPAVPYASWGIRLGAYLLDGVIALLVILLPALVGGVLMGAGSTSTIDAEGYETWGLEGIGYLGLALVLAAFLLGLAFTIWNQAYRQGRTGQSLGKKWLGIAVVKEATGRPIGFGAGFGRLLMHSYVDTLFGMCIPLGFLWPLWDPRKRTWGDMAVSSIVVTTSKTY
jgi:uncharacterized RDD family membrane protein YckC